MEVRGRKDRRLEVEKMRRQEYGGRKDRSLEGEKIRRLDVEKTEDGKGEKVRRSEKQKIGRPPVKSSFGGQNGQFKENMAQGR